MAAGLTLAACDSKTPPPQDAGGLPDVGRVFPEIPVATDHCDYRDLPPTAGQGGTVSSGAVSAGTAEALLDLPLGASLAAYTDRASTFGGSGFLDGRRTPLAGTFAPSVGIETIPRLKALAITAGDETIVILKVDIATAYAGLLHDVEAALGPEFAGKVMIGTSHSHSSFGNYSGHEALAVGFGAFRASVYEPLLEQTIAVARAALDARVPAQIGIFHNGEFDREDRVNRDRRGANDELAGGRLDDHHLFVIRVDTAAGEPMALLPIFGMHGTIHSGQNAFISTDSTGGVERVLEESFDTPILVMHLQGAGGDVSPAGRDSTDCSGQPACFDFARPETVGLAAREEILAAWEAAGESMASETEMEMLTRSVPLGPDWRTFRIRGGALEYAPFDFTRTADMRVFDEGGQLISPIDEFNAPYGAALCSDERNALAPEGQIPGTRYQASDPDEQRTVYRGCNRLEGVVRSLSLLFELDFGIMPICDTTRTVVTALRIGDWLVGTLPGEPVTLLAEHLREDLSPVDPERTIIVGYAQDHGGYLMRPEDWLSGGYEPSITFWGPLEGEYVGEQMAALLPLVMTSEREDAMAEGTTRVATPMVDDGIPTDPSPDAGTVPAEMPEHILTRLLRLPEAAQPAPTMRRFETTYFTWIGQDPLEGTPRVSIEREETPGMGDYAPLTRRSGRVVHDGDFILSWTPDPLASGVPGRVHYWTVEWEAVAPMGLPGALEVGQRGGLPLGRYRFVVEGPSYTLRSEPFEVTEGEVGLAVAREADRVTLDATYLSPFGFRLLSLDHVGNRPVPLTDAGGPVTVEITLSDGSVDTRAGVAVGAAGRIEVAGVPADARSAAVIDAWGNRGSVDLP